MDYDLILPFDLSEYSYEVEAKGYLSGVKVIAGGITIEFVVYDSARLAQEIADEIRNRSYFFEKNLLVVPQVNNDEIIKAIRDLSVSRFNGVID